MLQSLIRIYRVKVVDIFDLTPLEANPPPAAFSLMISVVNYKCRRGVSTKDLDYIDPKKQIYRFDTASFRHGNTRLNQQFLVPGTNNQVSQ